MQTRFNFGTGTDLGNISLSLEDLLSRGLVERERLEYKRGWNPEEVLHTLCAFANDFYNLDGGYIVVGIATTEDGAPVWPPVGLAENELDRIQRKIEELGHKIFPQYHPIPHLCIIEGHNVLVLQAPGGEQRPYKTLKRLSKNHTERAHYIRRNACTVEVTTQQDEAELISLANKIPYDDRLHQNATLSDLDMELIVAYLRRVKSGLLAALPASSLEQVGLSMNIVGGPPEARHPKNVGLMFFNPHPEQFFPQTQIDVVQFPDGVDGGRIIEKTFTGPIGTQLVDALDYLQTNVLQSITIKQEGRAEAVRSVNYPYAALEEILPNAIYHRAYDEREPIEVRVEPDRIRVISFPGPHPSIRMEELTQGRLGMRRYRNRRIGEFLKELRLTEGRSTGIPKIIKAMHQNGSPPPHFETDAERSYFEAILPIHPAFLERDLGGDLDGQPSKSPSKSAVQEREKILLAFCRVPQSRAEIQQRINLKHTQNFRETYLHPLLENGLLAMTIPDKPTSRLQKYRTTREGLERLKSLS